MNKREALILSAGVLLGAALGVAGLGRPSPDHPAPPPTADRGASGLVAGPGRVEPASEEVRLGSELSGKLRQVNVEEGDVIVQGQLLAVLENDEYQAAVKAAESEVRVKQAVLRKVVNGAREQERSAALAAERETEAVLNQARNELERGRQLLDEHVIAQEQVEREQRAEAVAEAQFHQAQQRHSLLDDRAREEDRAIAQAELELARARLAEARARLEKTFIRSPLAGSLLRKHHRSGESVLNSSTVPDPIFTVGNKEMLRVRVEIDEADVNRVRVGQAAYVTADAFRGRQFPGRVLRVAEQLGRKNIHTDEPTERVDNKVLEVLVELAQGAALPVGLRVDAFVLASDPPQPTHVAASL
jgi:HlyD family secretion protein